MISVIDLSGDFTSTRSDEAIKLRKACEGLGCFRVINHGVPLELMAEVKSLITDLMDLPSEIKRKNKDDFHRSGYIGPAPDRPHHESVGLIDVRSSQALDGFCSELQISPLRRITLEKYAEAMNKLTVDVASKVAKSIGLESGNLFESWAINFVINGYKFTPETVGTPGIKLHTDTGFVTLLQDDAEVSGLEIQDVSGEFVDADPLPGSFCVNIGDSATLWSNGRLRNSPHRVECKVGKKRCSIATILAPPREIPIEAPTEFVDAQHPRLYSSVTYADLRRLRLENEFNVGEVLDLFRVGS